ncbi:MAG: DNA-binding response regulator [Actinomycetota bacterium]|jgi:DNA-binding NarL/FixJ family response regulator|nr:MAG: DNA-binding response regulator [Actinomycetota bacterium]
MARRAALVSAPAPAPAPRRRIGVVLVDALPVVRAGLRLLIEDRPDLEVLAEVGDGEGALDQLARTRRSRVVVLVGLGLSGERDAYWVIRTVRERFPSHAILAMGANAEPAAISRALFLGADGFVDKNLDPVEFLQALRAAARGEMVLAAPPSVALGAVARTLDRRRELEVRLTEREREVLEVAAEGLTARQIADRLGVRERTVTTHLARIYGKLGVGNRLSAIRVAARSGLVSVGATE